MAKKKTKKSSKKGFTYSTELYGVLMLLAGIIGIGRYGPVGSLIASFAIFLVGVGYNILLLAIIILGGYLIIKREWPCFLTTKMLGAYLFIIGLLVLMHEDYLLVNKGNAVKVFSETLDQLTLAFSSAMKSTTLEAIGGGIVGCSFGVFFTALFSYNGMQIVAWTLVIVGICLFTGFSIFDFIRDSAKKAKEIAPKKEKKEKETEEVEIEKRKPIITGGEEEEEVSGEIKDEDKKIVISSIDELTKATPKEEVVEQEEEEEKEEPKIVYHNHPYTLPPLSILNPPKKSKKGMNQSTIEKNIVALENVLKDFGVVGKVVEVHVGPTVTQYELDLQAGTRVSKLLGIHREISLKLATRDVRIEAPIPGKSTCGIELANTETTPVCFKEVIEKIPKEKNSSKLLVPLGKNIMGNVIWCEIDKTPHLLVAGTTGSGKSVCINGIISSILMRATPDEVKLVMVDPKVVELSVYNGIPHLLCPVVTDPKKASVALLKMVNEMERRYETFSETKTKNIVSYNNYIENYNKQCSSDEEKMNKMPYIVVIIDELADLMMVAAKEVESSILRITQKARAAGIHLIVATQRPSTDVITGLIKANIPSRIAFAVGSGIDSRTILDTTGAEKLLGKGDMLFLPMGEISPQRIQGAFIDDEEIKRLIDYTVEQQKAEYSDTFLNLEVQEGKDKSQSQLEDMEQVESDDDEIYNDVVAFVIDQQKASSSLIQRRFKVGYNRAARIIDLLYERGIIGPQNGSKPREVLVQLGEEEKQEDDS